MKTWRRLVSIATGTLLVTIGLLVYSPTQVATQDAGWFTQDVIDTANSILGSGMARYLSGTGRNTLARQSGKTATGIAAAGGPPVISLPFQSDRFQIMVNNPAEDTFAFADVSSQSETAVAAYGNNVVVAFNDSTGFVFPFHSGMGWGHSSDAGASFTDLGNLPVPATGEIHSRHGLGAGG